jgi:hypothetical protein
MKRIVLYLQNGFTASLRNFRIYPAESFHFGGNAKYDFQKSAKEIFNKIKGDLKKITLDGIPFGAVDQWINNEDILMSAAHLASARSVYSTKRTSRDQIGDSMI